MINENNSILIIGDYAEGQPIYSGQTAKVRDYDYYIRNKFKDYEVHKIDTRYWKKEIVKVLYSLISECKQCGCLVLLLCGDGKSIKTLFPIVLYLSKKYHFPIYFSIVGGGILNEINRNKRLIKQLLCVEQIYVETKTIQQGLIGLGINRVKHAPVFSKRKSVELKNVNLNYSYPIRLCTYSRVIKEKGISDAIKAAIKVNEYFNKRVCEIDIYGEPDKDYKAEFQQLVKDSNGVAINKPILTDDNAIEELSKHYLMVFPTYYAGEGFPIAIIECFKAALPVVATDWHFNSEIIENRITGIVYKRGEDLSKILIELINNQETVIEMKKNCIVEAQKYDPDNILKDLYNQIASVIRKADG